MLQLKNPERNRGIVFDNVNYILNSLDFGASAATHTSSKGLGQVGETLVESTLEGRYITLTGYIRSKSPREMDKKKRELYQLLNPLESFQLVQDGYRLDCVAENTVRFSAKKAENNGEVAKFVLDAYCPSPCFLSEVQRRVNIALWQGKLVFPLVSPADSGHLMGLRQPSTIVDVQCDGDLPTGVILEFQAKGEVQNPMLLNVNTREFLRINTTMTAGERIRINTNYGEKAVSRIRDGVTENIMNRWDLDGTFLQLEPGENLLRYDAGEKVDNLEITVWFYPKYLGV